MARPAIEVDSRLEVIADLANLRTNGTSRRAIATAIADLVPSLTAFAAQLDDDNDPGAPVHALLDLEVKHLTT